MKVAELTSDPNGVQRAEEFLGRVERTIMGVSSIVEALAGRGPDLSGKALEVMPEGCPVLAEICVSKDATVAQHFTGGPW